VELLYIREIKDLDSSFTKGKSTRRLHFNLRTESEGDDKVCFECLAKDRYWVRRSCLVNLNPDKFFITDGNKLQDLIDWVIRRYLRSAFPDEFNRRLEGDKKRIRKLLKKHSEDIEGVFCRLDPMDCDLPPGGVYKLRLYVLISPVYYRDENYLQNIDETIAKIESIVGKNRGINLIPPIEKLSLDEITVGEYRQLSRWDFEDLSFKE